MFKLFTRLRKRDWGAVILIMGLTVLQVYCVMTMTDYIQYIVRSITYLSYQVQSPATVLADMASSLPAGSLEGLSWSDVLSMVQVLGMTDTAETISSIINASTGDVWYYGGMMILTATGYMLVQAVISVLASIVAASFATSLRTDLNKKVSNFSLANIHTFSTASLVTRTTNDIEQVQMTMLMMMRMVFAAPVTAIWAICKIQATSSELTLVTAIAIVALLIGLFAIMWVVLPKFKISQKYVDRINSITREHLSGIRVVRAYNAEGYQEEKFETANEDLTKLNKFTGRATGLLSPLMTIIMDGVTLAIYCVGATLINNGTTDYANISAFTSLATQIIMAFMMLLMMFIMWPRASVSAKRINEVLDAENTIKDPEVEMPTTEVGTIEFKDVSFRYPDADENVIEHVSFKAKEGDTVAVIGSTGSGKSSLINLIARLYDCTEGEILVDGVNVKNLKQNTLHSHIGFVPQKGVLFTGTIASNIKFGNENLSDEDMKEAAKISCSDEFIEKIDNQYEAPIAQGGTNVSGGQRQRLCIARAVAIHPEILVFDDSFSALDFKTDLKVRSNIKEYMPHTTKVIVAQRIGTIMDADEILVLDQGKVVGQGTHKELLENCDVYRSIALSQLSKEELGL